VVALPTVQADFGVARGAASLPYTLTMICFGVSSIVIGRLADRHGIVAPMIGAIIAQGVGYAAAFASTSLWEYALAQGLLIGAGSAATFAPLLAHVSLWFQRRRGIAVAVVASGNYIAGVVWPPIVQAGIASAGWRPTHLAIGIFCMVSMLPLTLLLRKPPPAADLYPLSPSLQGRSVTPLDIAPGALQALLVVAGLACCVAMSMPQVHLVAYCSDLGYGPARGAQMLSFMFACGIVSRLVFGVVSDRIGGLRTLLIGSTLQGLALCLFLPFDGLASLFVIAGLFGLFQGGIVPSYAMIVRELFSPREAGARIGLVITATMFGMALGGWMSGAIFDLTGSYHSAFVNGIAWNVLNVSIAAWLLRRSQIRPAFAD